MDTLVDLIFKGNLSRVNFDFINKLISQSRDIRFSFPENTFAKAFSDIIKIFKSNSYVDFIIAVNYLDLYGKKIPDVFVNIGRNDEYDENVEVLLFFDVKDLNKKFEEGLKDLYDWSVSFRKEYHFDRFFCQTDGVNYDGNYFFEGK